jgi:hypothetical protein
MAASGESEAWVFDKRLQTFADAGLIEQAQHFQFKRTINRWIRVGSHNERQEDGAPSSSDMHNGRFVKAQCCCTRTGDIRLRKRGRHHW